MTGGDIPGRIQLRLKVPTNSIKLSIILVAGVGFEPATFGL